MSFRPKNKKLRVNQHNSLARPRDVDVNPRAFLDSRKRLLEKEDELDSQFGYHRYTDAPIRTAFVINVRETFIIDDDTSQEHAAVDVYCLQEDGGTFKTTYVYQPYLFLRVSDSQDFPELEIWIHNYFNGIVASMEEVYKEDLDLLNHLSGKKQRYIKLIFRTVQDLQVVRRYMLRKVDENERQRESVSAYDLSSYHDTHQEGSALEVQGSDQRRHYEKVPDSFEDLREYDLPYLQRVQIDTGLRVGLWYDFSVPTAKSSCSIARRSDLQARPIMRCLAYDIETCKAPLKFPNAEHDQIMMISLMLDGHGLLITNRSIVSENIDDFEYTPLPEYKGPFRIINAPNEKRMLEEFIQVLRSSKPQIIVSYNGDFFDFPFVDDRAKLYGISLADELGITVTPDGEYKGRFMVHLDAFYWVQRDSYLPQGSQGLKAVTKAKLKYDPIELDPEDMMPFAIHKPHLLAQYSVSDAVATYYLYIKYVHLFIFSLCSIIPLPANDVLRKGSGTLCEMLLMDQAYSNNVIAPNKQIERPLKFYKGHVLESETYVGGHVECLHSGVFRSDIPIHFEHSVEKLNELIETLDEVLTFAVTKEWKVDVSHVTNYDEVFNEILGKLKHLRDHPNNHAAPLIYHYDVGAMYPNIILTNRLQPYAIVDDTVCASCDFNVPDAECKRTLEWTWRGKYYLPSQSDYQAIRSSLQYEPLPLKYKEKTNVTSFSELNSRDQAELIIQRIKEYASRQYKRLTVEVLEQRYDTTCQREHSFYIDTVRAFRDRRYEYKVLNKVWSDNLSSAEDELRKNTCRDMILLYDSMQLAHKCILNSFYGYVMRKGARWCSMPMAGIVTRTGAKLIQRAEDLVCGIGKVLELDTDGIWCVLPDTFPENFRLNAVNPDTGEKSSYKLSFPCSVLNRGVDKHFTNHQYHIESRPEDGTSSSYTITSECSIFFEVDGPYRAMILPASQHEGKNIKKRYAVFNKNGSLAELKGFEIKRRGELKLIKVFQEDVFKQFLLGGDLVECYKHVGSSADKWLDVLYSRGHDLEDTVVFDLLSEHKNMSEALETYGNMKSTSITCANRLGEFLGREMVKDKGLNCHFIIAKYPLNTPVSERAVPVAIFSADDTTKSYYLRRWLNETSLPDYDIRTILDWDYYIGRLNNAIQKIITIPAAFQGVSNPVPRVVHPDWLMRHLKRQREPKDKDIRKMFLSMATSNDPNSSNVATFPMLGLDIEETLNRHQQQHLDESDGFTHQRIATSSKLLLDKRATSLQPQSIDSEDIFASMEGNENSVHEAVHQELDDMQTPVDMSDDFHGWLRRQKSKWIHDIISKRQGGKNASQATVAVGDDLQSYFQQLQDQDVSATYQLIQAIPSRHTPGLFECWVLVSSHADQISRLDRIKISVPRIIYINSFQPNQDFAYLGDLCTHILPAGHQSHYLYAISMPEATFLRDYDELMSFINSHQIEGIYQTQTPLNFYLYTVLGNQFRPLEDIPDHVRLTKTYDLTDLRSIVVPAPSGLGIGGAAPTSVSEYLHHLHSSLYPSYPSPSQHATMPAGAINIVFVYHAETSHQSHGRVVYGIYSPKMVTVITGGPGSRSISKEKHQSLLSADTSPSSREFCQWLSQAGSRTGTPTPTGTPSLDQVQVRHHSFPESRTSADEQFQKSLRQHIGNAQVNIVVIESPTTSFRGPCMEFIADEFPFVYKSGHPQHSLFPELNWTLGVVETMHAGSGSMFAHLVQRLHLAHIAHLPLSGDTESTNVLIETFDLLFARKLYQDGHVLWASPSPTPDVGRGDNIRFNNASSIETNELYAEELFPIQLNNPGCYRGVSFDLHLGLFTLNALLNYSHLPDQADEIVTVVGSNQPGTADKTRNSVLYNHQLVVFKMFASVVLSLVSDFAKHRSTMAALTAKLEADPTQSSHLLPRITSLSQKSRRIEQLLAAILEYSSSQLSLLYTSVLHQFIYNISKKTLIILIKELEKMKCAVIHSTFDRLFICSNRTEHVTALTKLSSILTYIKKLPLFTDLVITLHDTCLAVLFLDPYNNSLLYYKDSANGLPPSTDDEDDDDDDGNNNNNNGQHVPHESSDHFSAQDDAVYSDGDGDGDGFGSSAGDQYHDLKQAMRSSMNSQTLSSRQMQNASHSATYDFYAPPDVSDEQPNSSHDSRHAPLLEMGAVPVNDDVDDIQHSGAIFNRFEVISNWNIIAFLPEVAQELFLGMTEYYLRDPAVHRAEIEHDLAQGNIDASANNHQQLQKLWRESMGRFMLRHLQPIILEHLTELSSYQASFGTSADAAKGHALFPSPPGSHLDYTELPLEYAKTVLYIFDLDKEQEYNVRIMKTNCFTKLGVTPFNPQSRFINPCSTYVLAGVYCDYCCTSRDIDLCRDYSLLYPILTAAGHPLHTGYAISRLYCTTCHSPYLSSHLESKMTKVVQRILSIYQIQDVLCEKCKQIKPDSLSSDCELCSTGYVNKRPAKRQTRQLQTFKSICAFHGFTHLDAVLSWVLQS